MPPLTVLGDDDVNRILHSFTKDDILELQETLGDALHWYSTSNDGAECCSDFQPERTHLKRKDGSTTLFMPASGLNGQGIKVVNIDATDDTSSVRPGLPDLGRLSLDTQHSRSSSRSSLATPQSAASGSTPTTATSRSSVSSNPASTNASVDSLATGQTSISSGTDSDIAKKAPSTIRGSLTLLDNLGRTTGLINAEEVTAFRTALASTMLLKKRQSVHDVTVFGAGKQAYWHIRLALLLRGDEIHHLNIVTRSFDSARNCLMRLYNPVPDDPDYVNPIGPKYNSRTQKTILTPAHTEYQRLLKQYVRASNVIFCTTPSTTPLFPASYLINPEGRKKGRYIACIGSYKPHMVELDPEVLRYAVAPHHEHRHLHKRQKEGGAVIVDTVSGCLAEAGEIIQAKLAPDQIVELGELLMLKREAERLCAKGEKAEEGCQLQDDKGLKEWLTRGNVIFKCVGIGLMDVVVGGELVRMARERGIGTTIENF
jgi:ornithine cyclodeaminase/alanine dehydrogenase-like protein (mu-crystallin family)